MKVLLCLSILLIANVGLAKRSDKYPYMSAQFLTKNIYKGDTAISYVKFSCWGSNCDWTEIEINRCFLTTTQILSSFHPQVMAYSTESHEISTRRMKVKVLSKDVFSASVPTDTNITTDYVITLNCSEKGARDLGCKVKAVTGSMITAEADRINIDLIDKSNVKDIKLDMCDDKFDKL